MSIIKKTCRSLVVIATTIYSFLNLDASAIKQQKNGTTWINVKLDSNTMDYLKNIQSLKGKCDGCSTGPKKDGWDGDCSG